MARTPSIAALRSSVHDRPRQTFIHAQIEDLLRREGSTGKPFWELRLRDASDAMTLRVWSDSPNFQVCENLEPRDCVSVEGEFFNNGAFGLDARRWELRLLGPSEREALFAGSAEARVVTDRDLTVIGNAIVSLSDPRLKALCEAFFGQHRDRFCRAAAARQNHHARRGGLLAHTAQMMRTGEAICQVYRSLNRDLLITGILFHDAGKLWETCPHEFGFVIGRELRGELMGHISIGAELVNALWRDLPKSEWQALVPPSEEVRLHVLHLVLSHHGELEFGSPIQPKTPEAIALHYIDNLDARLEMLLGGYASSPEVAPGIHERIRPLNILPVAPLAAFQPPPSDPDTGGAATGQSPASALL
jgi:3'-5' exoribonuclease